MFFFLPEKTYFTVFFELILLLEKLNESLSAETWISNCLKINESIKEWPRSVRPQIIPRKTVRKAFLKNPPQKNYE